jgi:diaminopimelate decarboxylase
LVERLTTKRPNDQRPTTNTVPGFYLHDNELVCDDVRLAAIAAAVGTPVYVYSARTIRDRYRALDSAFAGYPHRVHYALKANSSYALVRLMRELGSAVDANSLWEIEVARRAGFAAGDIVFPGVGKSLAELECAVPLGLKAINVESAGELERIEAIAERTGRPARVAIRVNPDIDAKSHPHISTGLKINKFGVPAGEARDLARAMSSRRFLSLVALHVHVGSQITSIEPLRNAAAFAAELAVELRRDGVELEYLDLGGGLGIAYDHGAAVTPEQYVAALVAEVRPTGLPIVIEPGRSIVGPAGALVAEVVDLKPRGGAGSFAVIDAGMTELLRPALYGAFHRIEPVRPREGVGDTYEIVGPVCESSDVVGRDRPLPPLAVGDLLAILDAGAYGAAMASNYNRRPLPVEVLVDGSAWRVVRRRQTIDDLLSLEAE